MCIVRSTKESTRFRDKQSVFSCLTRDRLGTEGLDLIEVSLNLSSNFDVIIPGCPGFSSGQLVSHHDGFQPYYNVSSDMSFGLSQVGPWSLSLVYASLIVFSSERHLFRLISRMSATPYDDLMLS